MINLVFHHDHKQLPPSSNKVLPVQLYGLSGKKRGDISHIGSPLIDRIKRLGVEIPAQAMDFLTIAMAVTAADTFVLRTKAANGWARQLVLKVPLCEPECWLSVQKELESALHFLSGDIWRFEFSDGGYAPPSPYDPKRRYKLNNLKGLDCVSLFSGGLDSAIGAIDLLESGRSPLLVSHSYKGDKKRQDFIAECLNGNYERFAVNAHPVSACGKTDITMRTRSCNFLAFAAVGACASSRVNQINNVELVVPENGFISLNAPLTSRRIGSLSTKTTHPYFLGMIQAIFDKVGIPCTIRNPYQFKTKGEMVAECLNQQVLEKVVDDTVSCSHWKRRNQQCGVCVPCIIRRAALHSGGFDEEIQYQFDRLLSVRNQVDRRDDLQALSIALSQKDSRRPGLWLSNSGPLPIEFFSDYQEVFLRGLEEVGSFLESESAI